MLFRSNKALIEIFSESVKLLLERLGGLEEEVKGVETEEVLARIESRDPSKKLSDIGGFTNEATTDQARNALEQVSFYAYSILFEYVRAGLLDEEQIEELGFGMGAVEAIRNFLREEEEKKLEEWKKDLEDNFPLLIDLKNAFSLSITDDEKLEKGIEDLETSLTNARAALVGEKGDQKEDHLKNTYWNVAEKKLEEWRERFRTHREEIAKNNLAEEKKDNINDFLNSIRGLQDALGEVPATGEEIWEMKISGAFNKFVDLEESLRKQRRKIQEEWTKLESAGILKEKTSSFLGDEEVNSEIKSLKEKYRDTISLLE